MLVLQFLLGFVSFKRLSLKRKIINDRNKRKRENTSMFGFCFLKLFLRAVFENINNTIFVLFENCYSSLNFSVFCVLPVFIVILVF